MADIDNRNRPKFLLDLAAFAPRPKAVTAAQRRHIATLVRSANMSMPPLYHMTSEEASRFINQLQMTIGMMRAKTE